MKTKTSNKHKTGNSIKANVISRSDAKFLLNTLSDIMDRFHYGSSYFYSKDKDTLLLKRIDDIRTKNGL